MSLISVASDQTVELEKSNENGDAQEVSVSADRSNQPANLEVDNENGNVRLTCFYKYYICRHRYGCYGLYPSHCMRACNFQFYVCRKLIITRGQMQDTEGSIQDALVAPAQPLDFEDVSENGDVQRRLPCHFVCYWIYLVCIRRFRRCIGVCKYYYFVCRREVVAQDSNESIHQDFPSSNEPDAVVRANRPVESEEEDENKDMQRARGKAYCILNYRICLLRFIHCLKACYLYGYFCLRPYWAPLGAEKSIQGTLTEPNKSVAFARPDLDITIKLEDENRDVQHRLNRKNCYIMYYRCYPRKSKRCRKACLFGLHKCLAGRRTKS